MTLENLRGRADLIGTVRMHPAGGAPVRRPAPLRGPFGATDNLAGAHPILDAGVHAVTFLAAGGWVLRHPPTCPADQTRECAVSKAAHGTLKLGHYLPGSYACHVAPGGWLRTTGGRR